MVISGGSYDTSPGKAGAMLRENDMTEKQIAKAIKKYAAGGHTQAQIAAELGIAQPTFNKILATRGLVKARPGARKGK